MGIAELLITAAALAMDCMAVSIAGGLAARKYNLALGRLAVEMSLLFGVFQGGMLALGYVAALGFSDWLSSVDHWIAFGLLAIIGGKMIWEFFEEEKEEEPPKTFSFTLRARLMLAVATSIDAMAVGVSFSLLDASLVGAALVVGLMSFALSLPAFFVGNRLGHHFAGRAELLGGIVLVGIGLKIVLEHTGVL